MYTQTFSPINFSLAEQVLGRRKGGKFQCPICNNYNLSFNTTRDNAFDCYSCGAGNRDKKREIKKAILQKAGLWVELGRDRTNSTPKSTTPGWYLSEELKEELAASAIPPGPWQGLNFSSITSKKAIAEFLGWRAYKGSDGWISTMGNGTREQNQFKPDKPIAFLDDSKAFTCLALLQAGMPYWKNFILGKPAKYLTSKVGYGILIPKVPHDGDRLFWKKFKNDKSQTLRITEGGKKTISSQASTGTPTVGLCGVSMWHPKKSKELLPELAELVSDRPVEISFDADFARKSAVRRQILDFGKAIEKVGGRVTVRFWDEKLGKGIDDLIFNNKFDESIALGLKDFKVKFPDPDEYFYEPDPGELREYQRYLEHLEFSDEQDAKRKRELWIEQKQKSDYRRWKRSLEFTADYLDTHGQYVDKRIFSPAWGSVAVRAPMGSGKTEALGQIVNYWIGQGKTGLLLGSRNSCLAQTCQRLQFPHLLFEGNGRSLLNIQPGDFWGHCIDSSPRWAEASEKPDIVILDEISSLIPHTLAGSTVKQNRIFILRLFGEILKEAEVVYLLDANLKNWEVDYLEYLSKKKFKRVEKPRDKNQTPLKIYNFIGSCKEELEFPKLLPHGESLDNLEDYKPNNCHHWRESFLRESKKGPSVVFSDSLKELKRLILLKHSNNKDYLNFETALANGILRIDSETRNYEAVRQFQANPVQFLITNNIVELYCSPSVESGISIKFDRSELEKLGKLLDDTRDYFVGFWLYNCHLPNEPISQMLLRVRDRNCPRYIFSRTFAPVPRLEEFSQLEKAFLSALNEVLKDYWDSFDYENEFSAIPEILSQAREASGKISDAIAGCWDGDMLVHHQVLQKLKAQTSYEKRNLRDTLLERLREDGAEIVDVLGANGFYKMKELNEAIAYHRAGEIFDAPDTYIAEDGYEVEMNADIANEWVRGYLVDPIKRLIGEKWLIVNQLLPGIKEAGLWTLDFLAEFKFLKPKFYSNLYHRCILNNIPIFKKLKALKQLSQLQQDESSLLISDISLTLPTAEAAISAGVKELIDTNLSANTLVDGKDESLQEIAKKCSHKSRSNYLGKQGKLSAVQYLNKVHDKFGFKFSEVRQKIEGEVKRSYRLTDLYAAYDYTPQIEEILKNKYERILEDQIAKKADFANSNPQTIGTSPSEQVTPPLEKVNNYRPGVTCPDSYTVSDTAAKTESQDFEGVKANSTPHNPAPKIDFDGYYEDDYGIDSIADNAYQDKEYLEWQRQQEGEELISVSSLINEPINEPINETIKPTNTIQNMTQQLPTYRLKPISDILSHFKAKYAEVSTFKRGIALAENRLIKTGMGPALVWIQKPNGGMTSIPFEWLELEDYAEKAIG